MRFNMWIEFSLILKIWPWTCGSHCLCCCLLAYNIFKSLETWMKPNMNRIITYVWNVFPISSPWFPRRPSWTFENNWEFVADSIIFPEFLPHMFEMSSLKNEGRYLRMFKNWKMKYITFFFITNLITDINGCRKEV